MQSGPSEIAMDFEHAGVFDDESEEEGVLAWAKDDYDNPLYPPDDVL